MKLLGWMHRKLMQNSTETIKNFRTGILSACSSVETLPSCDQQNYYTTKSFSPSKIKGENFSNSIKADDFLYQEESYEPFDFLSIGTFGMELLNTDPPTPTLPMPIERLTDQQIEITENDLNQLNYELEKFLDHEGAETENETSQRSSQESIITLGLYNKPIYGSDSEGHIHMAACPLQNYLFAASVELSERDKEVKKERATLEELFKMNNIVHDDDSPMRKCEQENRKLGNVSNFMKKVVKKFHPSSRICNTDTKDDASKQPTKKKSISKSLVEMFHKKVYPEEMTDKRLMQLSKSKKKRTSSKDDTNHVTGDNKFDQSANQMSGKNAIKLSRTGICKSTSPVINSGHWIKTDSDYLVLEL